MLPVLYCWGAAEISPVVFATPDRQAVVTLPGRRAEVLSALYCITVVELLLRISAVELSASFCGVVVLLYGMVELLYMLCTVEIVCRLAASSSACCLRREY